MSKRRLLLVLVMLPLLCSGREITLNGSVTAGPQHLPVAGVEVSLQDPPGLSGGRVQTDRNGNFRMQLRLSDDQPIDMPYLVLHLQGPRVLPMDIYQPCELEHTDQCQADPVNMPLQGNSSPLSDQERASLPQMLPGEYALLLTPYEMIPSNSPIRIDSRLFAASMRRTINTHLNELGSTPGTLPFDHLPPVDMRTIGDNLSTAHLRKRQAIGEYSRALAVVSGLGEWKSQDGDTGRVTLSTEFLLIPPEPGGAAHLLEIRDPNLPAADVNSLELASHLSQLWKRFSLVALAERELARARQAGDRQALDRIYAYVVAQRGQLTAGERGKAAELTRLLRRIDEALKQ